MGEESSQVHRQEHFKLYFSSSSDDKGSIVDDLKKSLGYLWVGQSYIINSGSNCTYSLSGACVRFQHWRFITRIIIRNRVSSGTIGHSGTAL
jgi:hypothetical protein